MTKTKREMLVGTLEDLHGTIDVVVFQNDNFEALVPVFQDDNIVSITGRLRLSQERLSLTATEINVLNDMYRPKDIHIDITHHQELAELHRLRELCRENQGDTPIYLHAENRTVLTHRKFWINRDAKEKIAATLNQTNIWEA